jgi:hypothetical protein
MILQHHAFPATASVDERVKAIKGLITSLKQDARPILLGPWRSELGFEALYWMPFLRWLSTQIKEFDQRACVVTRGGLAPLYTSIAHQGYDLYALRSVQDVRRENLADYQKTAMQKQTVITDWDEQVLTDAAKAMGLSPVYHVVHPAWMYWLLTPFWEDHVGMRYLQSLTQYETLPKPPKPPNLPEQYVAVKFYGRATFPYPESDVTQFIQRICGLVAATSQVVTIDSGGAYDDHVDVAIRGPNVLVMTAGTPEVNLFQQAQVLAHATSVIGTYGGAMQLALRMGVPTVSFWRDFGGTARSHLTLSQWLGTHTNTPFLTGSITDTGLWHQVLTPPIVVPQPQQAVAS